MYEVYLGLLVAFFVTYFSLPVIIKIAELKKLVDLPDNRKIHASPIASLGGIGIFAGITLTGLLCIPFGHAPEFQYHIAAFLIIFFLGLKDDILVLSPTKKFLGQFIAAFLIVYKGGVLLTSFHGFMGLQQIPQLFGFGLTVIVIVFITNAFNLIDGIDGLAGSVGLTASILLGYFFLLNGNYPYAIMSFALSGSLIAFLFYNLQPARIFMGDTGSLLIGLVCSILVIRFIELAPKSLTFQSFSSVAVGFSFLAIPVLDTLRVFAIRLWNKRSPFFPDRNHIHHILLNTGLSHAKVTSILVIVNASMVLFAYIGDSLGSTWLIILMAALYFLGAKLLENFSLRSRQEKVRQQKQKNQMIGVSSAAGLTKFQRV